MESLIDSTDVDATFDNSDDEASVVSVPIAPLDVPNSGVSQFRFQMDEKKPYFFVPREGSLELPMLASSLMVKVLWGFQFHWSDFGSRRHAAGQRALQFALTEACVMREVELRLPPSRRLLVATSVTEDDVAPQSVLLIMKAGFSSLEGVKLETSTAMAAAAALAVGHDIASVLDLLHRYAGRAHCDVSTSNIVASDDGTCHLIDYGESRTVEGRSGVEGPSRGGYTTAFADPRLLESDSVVAPDFAVDVYSLGKVLEALGALTLQDDGLVGLVRGMLCDDAHARPTAAQVAEQCIEMLGGEDQLTRARLMLQRSLQQVQRGSVV